VRLTNGKVSLTLVCHPQYAYWILNGIVIHFVVVFPSGVVPGLYVDLKAAVTIAEFNPGFVLLATMVLTGLPFGSI